MPEHKLKFKLDKTTKNTVKFEEVPPAGKPAVIGQLYVQKWAAGDSTELEVVVKFPDPKGK